MADSRPQLKSNADFVRLWTTGSRRVYAYILTLVTNRSDAEDLLQEVGVTAWEKFHEFQPDQDFVAWACQHVGGPHFLLGDGTVRFVSENIDFALYQGLASRDQGEIGTLDRCCQTFAPPR